MSEESVIIELGGFSAQEIQLKVKSLLEEAEYDRFTILLKVKDNTNGQSSATPLEIANCFDPTDENFVIDSKLQQKFGRKLKRKDTNRQEGYGTLPERGVKKAFTSFRRETVDQRQTIGKSQFIKVVRAIDLYYQNEFESAIRLLLSIETDILEENRQAQKNDKSDEDEDEDKATIPVNTKMYSEVSFHLGNCYYRMKEFEKAIHYYKMQFPDADLKQTGQKMNNLGTCYANKMHTQQSLKSFSEALKIYEQFPEVDCSNLLNNIGLTYLKSGMYETAAKYFSDSIESRKIKSPDNEEMLSYSYFKMGICLKNSKKYEASLSSLLFAKNLAEQGVGNYGNTMKQLGLIYEIMEKWDEALTCYEKLSDYSEENIGQGYIYERVAYLHQKLGNHREFKKFMKVSYQEYRREGNARKMSELCTFNQR